MSEEDEFINALKRATQNARGHASYFNVPGRRDPTSKTIEEESVTNHLIESLKEESANFLFNVKPRPANEDPPDVEAKTYDGRRIALEITELVDGTAIQAIKNGQPHSDVWLNKTEFQRRLREILNKKDQKFKNLKGGPYPGGYIIIVYTDEASLNYDVVKQHLSDFESDPSTSIDRAFILVSYDPRPEYQRCRHLEISISKS